MHLDNTTIIPVGLYECAPLSLRIRAGQLQPTGGARNSLRTHLWATLVLTYEYIEKRGGRGDLTRRPYTFTQCTIHTPYRSQYAAIALTTPCTSFMQILLTNV